LLIVPDRKPRTECACHSVAFMRTLKVAPPGRSRSPRTLAVLLPGRAAGSGDTGVPSPDTGAFEPLGFGATDDLATSARGRDLAAGLRVWALSVGLSLEIIDSPLETASAVMTFITPFAF